MIDDDLIKEGNRNFSVAMIALESGDFAKSERLLRETVNMMGKTHPVSMLAMKTMGGIASEQGRFDDSLQVSLDLLDAQISTFGVNHAETSRTVRGILTMCKDLGKPEIANDISMMVEVASNMERVQTTQSLKRLRIADTEDDGVKEDTLRQKIAQWIAMRLAKLLKRLPILKYGWMAIPWVFLGGWLAAYGCLFYASVNSPHTGVAAVRHESLSYITADERRQLNFNTPTDVIVQTDSKSVSVPFKVIGFDWHDIGVLLTSSILEKENWLLIKEEGLRDLHNNVYYKNDAPEKNIVHQMHEVMNTANLYFTDKNRYPSKIEQISDSSFQYQNPFTQEMCIPSIQSVRLNDQPPEVVADFIWNVRKGGSWPGEQSLGPGVIHCCRLSYTDRDEIKQQFLMHGCDRYGKVITASDGLALLLQSDTGRMVDSKLSIPAPERPPTVWVLRLPPEVVASIVPFFPYRFAAIFGASFIVFLVFYLMSSDNSSRSGAAVIMTASLIGFVTTMICINL